MGALVGTTIWLAHLIQDKIAENEDEELINRLIKKIQEKTFDLKDNEELETLKSKYQDDIENIAQGNIEQNNVTETNPGMIIA